MNKQFRFENSIILPSAKMPAPNKWAFKIATRTVTTDAQLSQPLGRSFERISGRKWKEILGMKKNFFFFIIIIIFYLLLCNYLIRSLTVTNPWLEAFYLQLIIYSPHSISCISALRHMPSKYKLTPTSKKYTCFNLSNPKPLGGNVYNTMNAKKLTLHGVGR